MLTDVPRMCCQDGRLREKVSTSSADTSIELYTTRGHGSACNTFHVKKKTQLGFQSCRSLIITNDTKLVP
ncbi:hypothetical protein BST61_g258 [Cercospora zeina]